MAIEWTLGLVVPLLVAGPLCEPLRLLDAHRAKCLLDYIVQGARFVVEEGFGCTDIPDGSGLTILFFNSWSLIPPLISVIFYYRAS